MSPARTLYIAGQVGILPDGTIPDGIVAQSEAVFANMRAVLDVSGMSFENVVKIEVFLLHPDDRAGFSAERSKVFTTTKPTSTLLYVSGLANPKFLVEVEAIAVEEA